MSEIETEEISLSDIYNYHLKSSPKMVATKITQLHFQKLYMMLKRVHCLTVYLEYLVM